MKKPVVDYREFRFSKINEPRFSHLWLLLGWVIYFALYFITENLIPAEECHTVHCALDDMIPFCEYFIVPYFLWYLWVFGSLLYFMLYDIKNFKNLQKYIMVTQALAMAVYILWPNKQELRPEFFPRENVFTDIVELLYAFDTNTGVCPSLHCAYSIGIASVFCHEKRFPLWLKLVMILGAALVCVSTFFVKQHSAVGFFAAIPVCLIAEVIVYHLSKRSGKM